MAKKIVISLIVLGVLGGGLAWMLMKQGNGAPRGSRDESPLQVVTTTTMVTDMVKSIGAGRVSVQGMMGAQVDPHSYQVTFSDTAALQKADLVFYSGLHLEGKMQDVLEKGNTRKGGVFAITEGIPKELQLKPQAQFDGYHDPHAWGNPALWANCISVVVKALSETDPEGAESYKERGAGYFQSWRLSMRGQPAASRKSPKHSVCCSPATMPSFTLARPSGLKSGACRGFPPTPSPA